MPLYEFFCSKCQKRVEELCSSNVRTVHCPICGSDAHKVFSTFRTGGGASEGGTSSGCSGCSSTSCSSC